MGGHSWCNKSARSPSDRELGEVERRARAVYLLCGRLRQRLLKHAQRRTCPRILFVAAARQPLRPRCAPRSSAARAVADTAAAAFLRVLETALELLELLLHCCRRGSGQTRADAAVLFSLLGIA